MNGLRVFEPPLILGLNYFPGELPAVMTYEEWIQAGKDPRWFVGEFAHRAHFKEIERTKALRRIVAELKGLLREREEALAGKEVLVEEFSGVVLELMEKIDRLESMPAIRVRKREEVAVRTANRGKELLSLKGRQVAHG